MASSDSQIYRSQRGCPKRAELPDVNVNTGAQSINTVRVSLSKKFDANHQETSLKIALLSNLQKK